MSLTYSELTLEQFEQLLTQLDRLNENLSAATKQNQVQCATIINQHNEILEKNLQINQLEQMISKRNDGIANLQATSTKALQECQSQLAMLEEASHEIRKKDEVIAKQELVIQQLRDTFIEKDSAIIDLKRSYEKAKELEQIEHASWHYSMNQKSAEIASLKQQLAECTERAQADDEHWAAKIAECDATKIADLQTSLAASEQKAYDYLKLAEAESERASLWCSISNMKDMVNEYTQHLADLHIKVVHATSMATDLRSKLDKEYGDCDDGK